MLTLKQKLDKAKRDPLYFSKLVGHPVKLNSAQKEFLKLAASGKRFIILRGRMSGWATLLKLISKPEAK